MSQQAAGSALKYALVFVVGLIVGGFAMSSYITNACDSEMAFKVMGDKYMCTNPDNIMKGLMNLGGLLENKD